MIYFFANSFLYCLRQSRRYYNGQRVTVCSYVCLPVSQITKTTGWILMKVELTTKLSSRRKSLHFSGNRFVIILLYTGNHCCEICDFGERISVLDCYVSYVFTCIVHDKKTMCQKLSNFYF